MRKQSHRKSKAEPPRTKLKIFGVGTAGINILEEMAPEGLAAKFIAVGPDEESLAKSSATEQVHLETKLLRGLGSGGDPERGRAAAEENEARLKGLCEGADVVFILAGLGGGAGTGVCPVLARLAKEAGALALAFVTMPFDCEGTRRQQLAAFGIEQLKSAADGVICLPNQKVLKLIDENTSVVDTFKVTNELLAEGVRGIWRLMTHKGLIEIHFADLCALLRDRHGESSFATAEACGATRSREVLDKVLTHPMLDDGRALSEADAVLVSLIGGPDLAMAEVNRVMEQINSKCDGAHVIMGAAIDEAFRERLAMTIVATCADEPMKPVSAMRHKPEMAEANGAELDTQLLNQATTARPHSRFVPPPPTLPPEKLEQLAKQTTDAVRRRKGRAKLRQTQLPLEIVTKGRFDKSEPTIHKGEDLDVPTYIRRGVALN
jgi:cell division protein FtsZ